MSEEKCNVCNKNIPPLFGIYHLAACIYDKSIEMGYDPPCTCHKCKGRSIHCNQEVGEKRKRIDETEVVEINNNNSNELNDQSELQWRDNQANTSSYGHIEEPSSNQLTGNCCIVCNNRRSNRHLPFIHIGRFIKLYISKKEHLNKPDQRRIIQRNIDNVACNIRINRSDNPIDMEESDNITSLNELLESTVECSGFRVNQDKKYVVCKKDTDKVMWMSTDKNYYFCCGFHLLTFFKKYKNKSSANIYLSEPSANQSSNESSSNT